MRRVAAAAAGGGPRPVALRRIAFVPLLATVLGVVILSGLGVWQVERLQWKTDLLRRIAALQTAPPEPLNVVLNRIQDHVDVDFTHVVFTCPDLERLKTARIYAVSDEGVGDRIITACPVSGGAYRSILVDRGFLPEERSASFRPAGPEVEGPVVGVLRSAPKAGLPGPDRGENGRFFARRVDEIAAALGAADPAPVFFMLESPAPRSGPVPAPVPTDIPNNHLGYAVTWFGLALALIAVYSATRLKRPKA